mmetsp:Transcript_85411/g.135397  ORF Transcript_85411/g.135397 Transcript_85411/m.135397 type:complete len:308 (+) Transcript_85411:199-1122(+)
MPHVGATLFLGSDQSGAADNVLWGPNSCPTVVHGGLICHGVVGFHLHGIVVGGGPAGPEDLCRVGAWPIFHATFKGTVDTIPVATLLVDVSKKVHLGLGAIDGSQQLLAGAPVTPTRHIKDAVGSVVSHKNVNTFWDVIIGVSGSRVATASVPSSAPNLQAQDLGQFVVQHFGIGDLALEIVRALGFGFGHPTTIQTPVGVPKVVIPSDDEHVPILVLDRAKPVVEVAQFTFASHFGHIARMDENIRIRQVPSRTMQAMGVADVEDGHHGISCSTYFEAIACAHIHRRCDVRSRDCGDLARGRQEER